MSRGDELRELVGELSRAAEKARRLSLPTTVYLLSMALVEVKEATEAADGDDDDGAA
ncbi:MULTISPECIES: hypothetical protein [unclassified Bradyrhizobium]|uniref:hypothetical protein n=1 Tax=unclassified Bradyrhizobium TaxID=2631580 RepID=UPI002479C8C9|nr:MULTISPECIES: hypothetical protein [unclassified Bradyrhizobium]WGR68274.1 hypothetical protein MTX24_22820 [Bradyrhizobium sp. ISRA426]WGR80329.1 hypothetical protein MTX21_07935 [Bradyrhizobium sp. ISRA430]WGR83514.1 hypothetical protein MTX25_22500 [Bradyrhizobium sp. ISRA432]